MRTRACVFLGVVLAILLLAFVVAADDPNQNAVKTDEANHVADEKYYGGSGYGGGGWGGYGGGGGWNGGGGGRGWGGGGGGRGWGGGGGGRGWGGGGGGRGCRYGQCCGRRYYGGCGCCYSAQEALAYMQSTEATP